MANVYTRHSKLPRTVTLSDFGFKSRVEEAVKKKDSEPLRLHSPTRRINPQPIGLVYQSPYNRYNQTFGIWNPNHLMTVMRTRTSLPHLRSTNFSCKHENDMIRTDKDHLHKRQQPNTSYTRNTIQRECFKWPTAIPKQFEGMVKTSRYGHTPHKNIPVTGIVPNSMASFVPTSHYNDCYGMEGFNQKKREVPSSAKHTTALPAIEGAKKASPSEGLKRLTPARCGDKVVVVV